MRNKECVIPCISFMETGTGCKVCSFFGIEREKILMKERGVMDFYTRTIESCNPNELFQREIIEICRKQLEQMPELTKQVFIAHKLEGKSYKEIADMLCINLKKVDRELQQAAMKLRLSLKDYLLLLLLIVYSEI